MVKYKLMFYTMKEKKNSSLHSDVTVLKIENSIESPKMKKKVHKTNMQNLWNK
jgi:hypothetical protein